MLARRGLSIPVRNHAGLQYRRSTNSIQLFAAYPRRSAPPPRVSSTFSSHFWTQTQLSTTNVTDTANSQSGPVPRMERDAMQQAMHQFQQELAAKASVPSSQPKLPGHALEDYEVSRLFFDRLADAVALRLASRFDPVNNNVPFQSLPLPELKTKGEANDIVQAPSTTAEDPRYTSAVGPILSKAVNNEQPLDMIASAVEDSLEEKTSVVSAKIPAFSVTYTKTKRFYARKSEEGAAAPYNVVVEQESLRSDEVSRMDSMGYKEEWKLESLTDTETREVFKEEGAVVDPLDEFEMQLSQSIFRSKKQVLPSSAGSVRDIIAETMHVPDDILRSKLRAAKEHDIKEYDVKKKPRSVIVPKPGPGSVYTDIIVLHEIQYTNAMVKLKRKFELENPSIGNIKDMHWLRKAARIQKRGGTGSIMIQFDRVKTLGRFLYLDGKKHTVENALVRWFKRRDRTDFLPSKRDKGLAEQIEELEEMEAEVLGEADGAETEDLDASEQTIKVKAERTESTPGGKIAGESTTTQKLKVKEKKKAKGETAEAEQDVDDFLDWRLYYAK